MKTMTKFFILTIGLLLLVACQQAAEPEAAIDLAGTNWILSSLNGELPVAGTVVSLQFAADGSVGGTDGCNRFGTSFTQDGTNLTINQPAASTMMACEEPVMNQAAAYMTALAETTNFSAAATQLSLLAGDQIRATFVTGTEDMAGAEAAPEVEAPVETSSDLAGTSWQLSALNGEVPITGTTMFLQFGVDGTVSGSDGCNQLNTTYTQDGSALTISQTGATTMMACPEPVMEQASAFTAALAGTTSFTMTESDLLLQNGDQVLATFVAESSDLAGSAWDVVNYNNGREAVVGLLLGTEISANFGLEGDLSGNAGCNQYFTSFSAGDGAIEIGPAGATMRYCSEPAGIMEQEAEYLAALESAATYSIRGDMLELRTAEDALAVIMVRKLEVDLPDPEPATASGRVNAPQGLNVRSGPGPNFPVIGFARDGDEGEIVGRSADSRWWAAAVPSAPGGVGWVSADFVIATNTENVPVLEVAPPVVVVPTAVATPSPVPPPTATPSPQVSFTADRTNINQGECTTLRWSVENIQAVWVYPQGERFENFPRTGQGSEQVCPTTTTTYEMRVQRRDGSTLFRQVTINVAGPSATATSAPASDPLAGTRWEVVNFNNGVGGVVSLIAGSRISMEFGTDGRITGTAGCNTYFASYQVNGSGITIGQPGASQLLCAEPEGVMDQEAQFLAALQSASSFRINGSLLEMRTAGDQIAVVSSQIP